MAATMFSHAELPVRPPAGEHELLVICDGVRNKVLVFKPSLMLEKWVIIDSNICFGRWYDKACKVVARKPEELTAFNQKLMWRILDATIPDLLQS